MGFDDLFEIRDKHRSNYREEISPDTNRYPDRYSHGESNQFNWLIILEKIKSNKKHRIYFLLAGILVLTIVISLILVLLPLIVKLIGFITQNGLQGLLDEIAGFVDKILNGRAN